MKLEERLNDIIEEKDEKIEELEEKINRMKVISDLENLRYQIHQYFNESELQKKLPVPRLEMRLKPLKNWEGEYDWYYIEWHYGIVYKHYSETHNDNMLFIPFSKTTSSGGEGTFESHYRNGKLDTPFRDGIHIFAESKVFNLPAFIICEEKNIVQEINVDVDINEQLSEMVRESKL